MDIVYIVPLSTVAIIIFALFVIFTGGSYGIREYFLYNLTEFLIIAISIAVVVAIIHFILIAIVHKKRLNGLWVFLCSLFSSSQLIFFIAYGGATLPYHDSSFIIIWDLIVFWLYIIFIVIDIIAFLLVNFFAGIFTATNEEKGHIFVNLIYGGIGWLCNLAIFVLIPLIF